MRLKDIFPVPGFFAFCSLPFCSLPIASLLVAKLFLTIFVRFKKRSMTRRLQTALLIFPLLSLLLLFCQKERFTTKGADQLEFSTDTLRFDTVFTQLGSATRILKVYNRHAESIRISRIYLANGASSRFNLNIDGLPGDNQRDMEIAPNDSLYVFAEVIINPNQPISASPFVLDEELIFETNGNVQTVVLEAFGQNANYLPSRFGGGGVAGYQCTNGEEIVWDDSLPYVIYGILVIDGCTLRIPAGTHVYVHGGFGKYDVGTNSVQRYNDGYITFTNGGRLLVEGTPEKPVIFEGDRLESEFDADAGQWVGLWLQDSTAGHRLEHCIIRNSIIGLRVDPEVDVLLRNVQIYNTSNSGLIAYRAIIDAENCLFYNNGSFCIQLEWGGNYDFKYCTAASYGVDGETLGMTNFLCLDPNCNDYDLNPLKARFRNCIFYGSKADQITLSDRSSADSSQFYYQLEHCIVRVKELLKPNAYPDFLDHCQPCLNATPQDTIFLDPNRDNYRLDSLGSIANGYAVPLLGTVRDLDGKLRDVVKPDAGAFEIEF